MSWPLARSSRVRCDMRTMAPSSDCGGAAGEEGGDIEGSHGGLYAMRRLRRRGGPAKMSQFVPRGCRPALRGDLLNLHLYIGRTALCATLADLDLLMKRRAFRAWPAVLLAACSKRAMSTSIRGGRAAVQTQSRSEPIFYNGKHYELRYSLQ